MRRCGGAGGSAQHSLVSNRQKQTQKNHIRSQLTRTYTPSLALYLTTFFNCAMKRTLSWPDLERMYTGPSSPKRRKPSPSDSGRDYLLNPTQRSPRTLPLTPKSLEPFSSHSLAPEDATCSIEQWASGCDSSSGPAMAPTQTPSVTSNDSDRRRASKLSYRR